MSRAPWGAMLEREMPVLSSSMRSATVTASGLNAQPCAIVVVFAERLGDAKCGARDERRRRVSG